MENTSLKRRAIDLRNCATDIIDDLINHIGWLEKEVEEKDNKIDQLKEEISDIKEELKER